MKNPLLDYNFLRQLDRFQHKTVYAKIILLGFNEQPVQEIQGRISTGSINVDGTSAVRRTCSLTMLTDEEKIDNIYWGLKNKFKLEIGLENHINTEYPNIIWFKQGLYIITGLNESLNGSSYNISISGKDKGCLINGDIGGVIPSTTNFGKIDIVDTDNAITTLDYPIKDIVKNLIITFGGEEVQNVIVNDIDNYGMELISYKGDVPLYMLYDEKAHMVTNMTFDGKTSRKCEFADENGTIIEQGEANFESEKFRFNSYVDSMDTTNRTKIYDQNTGEYKYSVIKFVKDEAIGYRKTELTYPGDLIANAGETVTSVLDKIKNMFPTFEYFYDIDGRFVFQEKKNYVNSSWSPVEVSDEELYVNAAALTSPFIYTFEDNQMLTAISKQPTLTNLKNDFAIQGTRKGVSGADILIHMRYAISDKPVKYCSIREEKTYVSFEYKGEDISEDQKYDWRELIYQMALDYYKYNQQDNFLSQIAENNPEYYPSGKTGYEMFYTDLQAYWRTLYNPKALGNDGEYVELENFDGSKYKYSTITGFNENVEKNPAVLDFWFDFMDTSGEMGKYSIQTIGHRPKAVNDSKTVVMYYKKVPQILFISTTEELELSRDSLRDYYNLSGYNFIQISEAYDKYFSIASRGKSAYDALDDLLYKHLYCSENITLTSIPIYYLQPNSRIFVRDTTTNINGEYLVNKITVPLTYNGTSSISAQLAPQRLY